MVEEQKDLANEINKIQIHPNVENVNSYISFLIVPNVCMQSSNKRLNEEICCLLFKRLSNKGRRC